MNVNDYIKAPGATLDYSLDYRSWLLTGETINSSTWAITSDQAPVAGDMTQTQAVIAGGVTTVWLTAGALGTVYTAANTVITSGGRTDTRSIGLTITQR